MDLPLTADTKDNTFSFNDLHWQEEAAIVCMAGPSLASYMSRTYGVAKPSHAIR